MAVRRTEFGGSWINCFAVVRLERILKGQVSKLKEEEQGTKQYNRRCNVVINEQANVGRKKKKNRHVV